VLVIASLGWFQGGLALWHNAVLFYIGNATGLVAPHFDP